MKNRFFKKRYLLILIIVIICAFFFDQIHRTGYILKQDYLHYSPLKAKEINKTLPDSLKLETLRLTFSDKDWYEIEDTRKSVIKTWIKSNKQNYKKHSYHKFEATYKGYKSKGKAKLFGMNLDHYYNGKLSYRTKFSGGQFFAKKKMNILSPKTRNYQLDFTINQVYKNLYNGICIGQQPIILNVNGENKGTFYLEDFFDKYLLESNRKKESFIFESGFQGAFHYLPGLPNQIKDNSQINYTPKGNKWKHASQEIIQLFQEKDPTELFSMIDEEKLNGILGFCFLLQSTHPLVDFNLHWYYNPLNHSLEPILRETEIFEIDQNKSIDDLWTNFYDVLLLSKKKKGSSYDLINAWIKHKGIAESKSIILSNAVTTAKHLSQFFKSNEYLNHVTQLNPEFSEGVLDIEEKFKHNIKYILTTELDDITPVSSASKKTIINSDFTLRSDFYVNKSDTLVITPGVRIAFENDANLFIHGTVIINGTKEKNISFSSLPSSNSSIYISSTDEIRFSHCSFHQLSALNTSKKLPLFSQIWQTSAAITLYETNAIFSNCSFSSNLIGDDMLNVFRCYSISLNNCLFKDVLSDALDSDFSNVLVSNCEFLRIGNDGVDGSLSEIVVQNTNFMNVEDKAISAGEESHFTVLGCSMDSCEIALVAKDGSFLEFENVISSNNTLDFVAFTKKQEYPAASFKTSKFLFEKYLIEKSVIDQTGFDLHKMQNNTVEDLLYSNLFGKATVK